MIHLTSSVLAVSGLGLAPVTWSVGLLEPAVAGYALRLYRNLGARVGWWLFTTFCLLALSHVLQAGGVTARVLGPSGSFNFMAVVIPLLLLIGMAHTESTLASRVRAERKERKLRLDSECEAKENESLQEQLARLSEREKVLEDSVNLYHLLFTENPQPMWLFDRHSLQILAANNAALGQYGFTLEEFMAMTSQDILPAEEFAEFLQNVARPVSRGESARVWRHRRKGGLFEVEVRELDVKYGDCAARLMVTSDISQGLQAGPAPAREEKLEIMRQEPPPVPTESPLPQGTVLLPSSAMAEKSPATTSVLVAEKAVDYANSPVAEKAGLRTILLVEPDSRMRAMTRTVLEWNRYRVVETDSCSLAETVWPSQGANIDLLLTEMALPGGVSGLDLAARLWKMKPALKVLFIRDSNKPDGAEQMSEAELLAKPFSSAALLQRVSECFQAGNVMRDA